MQKSELLAGLKAERAQLERYLSDVALDRLAVPGVSGVYSVSDILAHLEAYDRALVTWLREARAGRVYIDSVLDQPDLDARNAIVFEANRRRNPMDVAAAFRQTLAELEAEVEALTQEELTQAEATAWFVVPRWHVTQALWKCIANDSYEHHQQHWPDIERWLNEPGTSAETR